QAREQKVDHLLPVVVPLTAKSPLPSPPKQGFRWSIKVDRIGFLDALENADLEIDEVVVDITRDHPTLLAEKLTEWVGRLGHERVRLSLPALTRKWEEKSLVQKVHHLLQAGFEKWEASNLSAWTYLGVDIDRPDRTRIDLATDWSVYVLNRLAAKQLLDWGV